MYRVLLERGAEKDLARRNEYKTIALGTAHFGSDRNCVAGRAICRDAILPLFCASLRNLGLKPGHRQQREHGKMPHIVVNDDIRAFGGNEMRSRCGTAYSVPSAMLSVNGIPLATADSICCLVIKASFTQASSNRKRNMSRSARPAYKQSDYPTSWQRFVTRDGSTLFFQPPGASSGVPLEATAEDKFLLEGAAVFTFDAAKNQMTVKPRNGRERVFTKEN